MNFRVFLVASLCLAPAFCARPLRAQSTPTATPTLAPTATPAPPISAEQYRDALVRGEKSLRALENDNTKTAAKLRRTFPPPATVKRSDGESQSAGNLDLGRVFNPNAPPAPRGLPAPLIGKREIRQARETLRRRRIALEEWSVPRRDGFYQPADAKRLVSQLESTNQIRTGPTDFQLWLASVRKGWNSFWDKLSKWLSSSNVKSPVKAPKIDQRWINFFFYTTVFSLLAVIAYIVWKNLGGKWGRNSAARDVRYLGGEDAELLRLPPDELRDRARAFADKGDFREALRHLYLSLLVNLDARGVWRYDTRRTNWEHIQALRGEVSCAGLVAPMSELTRRFDRVRYGNAPAVQSDWMLFQSDVQALETSLDNTKSTPEFGTKSEARR